MPHKRMSLTAKLIACMVFFIVVPIAISASITMARFNSVISDQINVRLYEGAKVVVKELHRYEDAVYAITRTLSNSAAIDAFAESEQVTSDSFRKAIANAMALANVDFIRLYDRDGAVAYQTDGNYGHDDPSYHARIVLYGLNGRVNTGYAYTGGRLELISAVPIVRDGHIRGVITVGFIIERRIIEELRNLSSFDISFHYNSGTVVTTLEGQDGGLVSIPVSDDARQHLEEYTPFTERVNVDAEYYQVKHYPLLGLDGNFEAAMSVVMPISSLMTANTQTVYQLGGLTAFLIAVAAVVGLLTTRVVTRPLRQLVRVGKRMRKGDLSEYDGEMHHDEVGELARSFNHMVDDLKTAFDDLEEANENLKGAHLDTILRLSIAAEFKDVATAHHIRRISEYSAVIAREYGLSKEEIDLVRYASPMHDIGKIGIPDDILLKDAKLTDDEFDRMKKHTVFGSKIFTEAETPLLQAAETISLTHHERYDGSGYPRGLKGDDIHVFGRIVAVADVFDALTNERVYKPPFPLEKAVEMITAERGKHFDPRVVDAFLAGLDDILSVKHKMGRDLIRE